MPPRPFAVLTRDPVDAQAYGSALSAVGLDVLAMPVTKTASADEPDALLRALDDGRYAAIVVASPRAANELAKAVRRRSPGAGELPEIWAVGPATRRALEHATLPAQHPPSVRDAVELATCLAASRSLANERVLVPRAEQGRIEPLDVLRAAGAIVVDVVAYRTIAAAVDDPDIQAGSDALVSGSAVVCLVFAPSQVAALAAVVGARGRSLGSLPAAFCAIGETTAGALRTAGVATIAVAAAATPEAMAQAVRSVYPPRA